MGILNITPDSFSDGGFYLSIDKALAHANELIQKGADILDIGGESTRPFSDPITEEEELKRVIPVIKEVRNSFPEVVISIDTYKAKVAERALEAGADMVNDISALRFDPRMIDVIRAYQCPIIIMHMQGTPKSMQISPYYENVVKEVKNFLQERKKFLLENGIGEEKIIVDPGIGFGKTFFHNLEILRNLKSLQELNSPILIGASRKSFIGEILNKPPLERDGGTVGISFWTFLQGVHILRVHNVEINRDAILVYKRLINA